MRNKTVIRNIVMFVAVFALLAAGFIAGRVSTAYMTDSVREDESNIIAVVNLDEGVRREDGAVNYAASLIHFSGGNYVYAGLEDARNGVQTGDYAAYIVIPAGFSADIESLNTVMSKSNITYEINKQLAQEKKITILKQVDSFIQSMADNVSLLYVEGILEEFHTAQDSALRVMENDKKDTSVLLEIKAYDLQKYIEFPQLLQPDMSITELDIQQYILGNVTAIEEIQSQYETGAARGEEGRRRLAEAGSEAKASLDDTNRQIEGLDVTKDTEGNEIYDPGLPGVKRLLADYDTALESNRDNIQGKLDLVEGNLGALQRYWTGMRHGIEEHNNGIQTAADDIADVLSTGTYDTGSLPAWTVRDGTVTMNGAAYTLTAADGTLDLGELERLLTDYRQNSSGTYRVGAASADIQDKEEIKAIVLSLLPDCSIERFVEEEDGTFTEGDAQENRKEADRLLADSLGASSVDLAADEDYKIEPISQTKLDDIMGSLRSDVVSPLLNRADEVKHAFQSSYADSDGKLSTFQSSLTAYDPLGHIDHSAIQDSYADMHDSTSSLQKEVLEKDTDRLESMAKTYETYTANEVALQQHIQEATKASEEAVVQGLAGAQKVKEESSRDNQERMESFTGKLPYTRIGKAENQEAGRFIVDPFWVTEQNTAGNTGGGNMENDAASASGSGVKEASETGRAVLEVLGAFAILGVIASVTINASRRRKKKDN